MNSVFCPSSSHARSDRGEDAAGIRGVSASHAFSRCRRRSAAVLIVVGGTRASGMTDVGEILRLGGTESARKRERLDKERGRSAAWRW